MKQKTGFTLIELLVAILIIGTLAAVSIPIMRKSLRRAVVTEAVTALGTIRYAERLYSLESEGHFLIGIGGFVGNPPLSTLPGINDGDLEGTFFSEECYLVAGNPANPDGFLVWCYIVPSLPSLDNDTAPRGDEVPGLLGIGENDIFMITMDEAGNLEWSFPGSP